MQHRVRPSSFYRMTHSGEREAIGERTREAMQHKRSQGERVGNIQYGYRLADNGRLEPNPAEQAALDDLRTLRNDGHTLRAVAAELNTRGHRTRRGSPWRLESVVRALRRSTN